MVLASDYPAVTQHEPAPKRQLRHSNPIVALPMLVAAVLGLITTTWIGLYTARGQLYDERAMDVIAGTDSWLNERMIGVLAKVSPVSAGLALLGLLVVALIRGRFRIGIAAGVLVGGANLTTQFLKHFVLIRPDLGQGGTNSLPSGHTTLVFSLVLAAVLVSPRSLRWLVALMGSAVATLTGLATVVAGWHRPSDVVAALLVTAAWAALVSAVLAGRGRDGVRGRNGMFPALLGAGLAAIGVISYGFGWSSGDDASRVMPFTALVIAGVSALTVGGYARLVSRTSD
jgi:membrane-associated phospholipid phosphatase